MGLKARGQAPLAYALEQAEHDLPPGAGNFLVVITSAGDECEGNACSVAARLVREGVVDRIFVVALNAAHEQRRGLACLGDLVAVEDAVQLDTALRGILRDTANWQQGVLALLTPGSPGRWVAGGYLGDTIEVGEGNYDVVIRSQDRSYFWENLKVSGEMRAVAGRRPPRPPWLARQECMWVRARRAAKLSRHRNVGPGAAARSRAATVRTRDKNKAVAP